MAAQPADGIKKPVPRKKKIKYKKITFMVTDVQKEALEVICKRQKTTPVRFLKSVVKKHTARYKADKEPCVVTENQLQLFDFGEEQVKVGKTARNIRK